MNFYSWTRVSISTVLKFEEFDQAFLLHFSQRFSRNIIELGVDSQLHKSLSPLIRTQMTRSYRTSFQQLKVVETYLALMNVSKHVRFGLQPICDSYDSFFAALNPQEVKRVRLLLVPTQYKQR